MFVCVYKTEYECVIFEREWLSCLQKANDLNIITMRHIDKNQHKTVFSLFIRSAQTNRARKPLTAKKCLESAVFDWDNFKMIR